MVIQFNLSDIRDAVEKTASSAGTTPSDDELTAISNRVETYLYVYPAKNDLVVAFKEAATAESIVGDIDKMSKDFPAQLTSARTTRLRAEQAMADQAKAKAEAENARLEVSAKIGDIASTVNTRLDGVNAIINDLKSRVPAIKSAAATAEIDIDDELTTQVEAIETAARGLLKCQTDVTKTSALKTAQTAEKKSLQHFTDANNAMIAINGIETRVNGTAEAAKAKKTKEKESAKKAKKNQVSKTDQFLESLMGHVVVSVALVVALIMAWLFTPWYVFGVLLLLALIVGVIYALSAAKGRARRGQNVAFGYIGTVVVLVLFLLLLPLVGKGPGSDRDLLPGISTETPAPTEEPVDCWQGENADDPACQGN